VLSYPAAPQPLATLIIGDSFFVARTFEEERLVE
jgi:hypothetical protein